MEGAEKLLKLEDCVRNDVGNKARRLAHLRRLRPTLFDVPSGLLVRVGFETDTHGARLDAGLAALGSGPYAVRSCGLGEDTADRSQAGRYETVLDVGRDRVPEAIARVRASLTAVGEQGDVLIQPMIRADHAGVLFTRSPDNAGLATCEYAAGSAEAIVAGRIEPRRVVYGRWSGRVEPEPARPLREMLRQVFLVGMTLEQTFGRPQDVEWAWDGGRRRLVVLQSRDITATVGSPHVDREQARVARAVLASRRGRQGTPVFVNAAVREVVSSPTRLTRSLVECLYAPGGALGRGLRLLGLPAPASRAPYVSSVFGRLTANIDVERQLFGFRLERWWAARRLVRRLRRDRAASLAWVRGLVDAMGRDGPHDDGPTAECDREEDGDGVEGSARELATRARWFTESVYPPAYAATLLAQMAGEDESAATLTSLLFHDLSALHHGGDVERFMARWGHRSAHDYELSAPRFDEVPEVAIAHARGYATLGWAPAQDSGDEGFIGVKERAKDNAIRSLRPLRTAALGLNERMSLGDDAVFLLDLADVQALATGTMSAGDLGRLVEERREGERDWLAIDLGDAIGLRELESLGTLPDPAGRLRGRMVSVRRGFKGPARLVGGGDPPALDGGEVIVTRHLEPRLVTLFGRSAGCIADLGGSLSHAAIVARELGHPVLILPGSSRTIRDGDLVEVEADGSVTVARAAAVPTRASELKF